MYIHFFDYSASEVTFSSVLKFVYWISAGLGRSRRCSGRRRRRHRGRRDGALGAVASLVRRSPAAAAAAATAAGAPDAHSEAGNLNLLLCDSQLKMLFSQHRTTEGT